MAGKGFNTGYKFKKRKHTFDYLETDNPRKQYGNYDDKPQRGRFKQQMGNRGGDSEFSHHMIELTKPGKPRKYTVSIAVPASILDATSIKDELRTYVVGQIARAAVIYSVDEIIVYDDGCFGQNEFKQKKHSQISLEMMKILLEYQELPQYLRKYFFGFDKNLRCVGLLNPLNSSHHLKSDEWCQYREGVVLEESEDSSSYVDCGLGKNVLIDQKLEAGIRVTLKFPLKAQQTILDTYTTTTAHVVSPDEPRAEGGFYWGYSVRIAESLSEVVTGSRYPDGYDLLIGTSDKGDDSRKIEFPEFTHALIVFGGVDGIEASIKADPQIKTTKPLSLFHFYLNTCSLQQARTIRTEEAVMISLCMLHDKFCSKGIQ